MLRISDIYVATYVKAAHIKINPQRLKKVISNFLVHYYCTEIKLLCTKHADLVINMPQCVTALFFLNYFDFDKKRK
jgi:hypothetical protein